MWQRLDEWDRHCFLILNRAADRPLCQQAARQLSRSGDGAGYALFATVAAVADPRQGPLLFELLLMAYAIELPLYWLLKTRLRRARPCQAVAGCRALVDPHDTFSLPSGHSAAAFLFATLLCWYIPGLGWGCFLWSSGVAWARVVLGVHYPGDVVAGASLGTLAALVSLNMLL
ncbi:phosphatase PAP2 family protein [Ferrimonas sediminicola]|uniref:undecaprenyl-diphosphate phosphatase n=1 Tax=Ferrimonas sediminicola TaxID=2569538 RepID=A0A4U1BJ10_9GAMM|nr:phosphatase PAP2 family protein [Ferrimonas sediminicola]TKB51152.1 phosphatase PAP2 family protein [Ferrimonas sediminicola]